MTRQGRYDQYRRLVFDFAERGRVVGKALEPAQLAKWLADFYPFVDGHTHPIYINGAQTKLWLFVVFTQAVYQFIGSRNALCKRVLPHDGQGIAIGLGGSQSHVSEGLDQRALRFV